MKILFMLVSLFSSPLFAKTFNVVTTTPDLAWAVRQIAGDKATVTSLLQGTENPHYLDATPTFIRLVGNADLVCLVGLDLEVGWLPKVLSRSGSADVQPGGKGYCDVGKAVKPLEVPVGTPDRSMGDVHPLGNPHYWLSPTAFAEGLQIIAETLSAVDPASTEFYNKRLTTLRARLLSIQTRNTDRLAGLNKKPLVLEYHKEFTYLLAAYHMQSLGSLEEKPGVPPSAGRIAEVAQKAKAAGVSFLLAAPYSPKRTLEKFEELSGIPVLVAPTSLTQSGAFADYEGFQDHLIDEILRLMGNRVAQTR